MKNTTLSSAPCLRNEPAGIVATHPPREVPPKARPIRSIAVCAAPLPVAVKRARRCGAFAAAPPKDG